MIRKQPIADILLKLLPMFAALAIETHIRLYLSAAPSGRLFTSIILQLLIESSPIFLVHYLTLSHANRKWMAWTLGFVLYPSLLFSLQLLSPTFNNWSLFSAQYWLFLVIANGVFSIRLVFSNRLLAPYYRLFSKASSLNVVLTLLGLAWALVMAGIFASVVDPMHNQPIPPRIESDQLLARPFDFVSYFLQFSFVGFLIGLVFLINRYVLIRHLLAKQGLLGFAAGCLVLIVFITPVFAQFALWLPLNSGVIEGTLLPSANRNVFAKDNYQFCFALLFISTPLILAFEREKQSKALIEIAQQKAQTELQLLQQQINPHFLFNTLNNLYALTLSQSDKAPDMVLQLANLLRYTVYEGQKELVPLVSEIDYIRNYLALQEIRVSSQCYVKTEFPDVPTDIQISPLLLIILLENAFKHGVEKCKDECHLDIRLQLDRNRLTMHCVNTLPKQDKSETQSGVGLSNLKRRLALLYPNKHKLMVEQNNGTYTAMLTLDLSQ